MSKQLKQLMEMILPRLARRLHRQLKRYRAGKVDDAQFTQDFEDLLQSQYAWLAEQGAVETDAALALHAAVIVLSGLGLAAEAEENKLPLEIIEARAIHTAAADIASSYDLEEYRAFNILAKLVARAGLDEIQFDYVRFPAEGDQADAGFAYQKHHPDWPRSKVLTATPALRLLSLLPDFLVKRHADLGGALEDVEELAEGHVEQGQDDRDCVQLRQEAVIDAAHEVRRDR